MAMMVVEEGLGWADKRLAGTKEQWAEEDKRSLFRKKKGVYYSSRSLHPRSM
jgi:hypothetical protein